MARDGEDELVAGYLSPRSRGVTREVYPFLDVCVAVDVGGRLYRVR